MIRISQGWIRGVRTEIQSEFLFFRMETSDWIAIGALAISIIALAGSGYSLYLQKQAHDREWRKEERERKADSVSLKIKLSKNSRLDKNPLVKGRASKIPINCYLLNDGGKTIFLKHLQLEAIEADENWHIVFKQDFLNGIPESIIEPGPQKHQLLEPNFSAEQISNLDQFRFRVKVMTTYGESYFSEVIDLKPIRFATR